jgi:hypothetical protein
MDELEAVNEMLMSIGQAPVNTLNVTGIKDVNIARKELVKVSRRVQTRGWAWNTDENYRLQPDTEGVIMVPQNALSVRPMSACHDFVIRRHDTKGLALWDRKHLTWSFVAPVATSVIWGFAFEDLPEAARCYIATAAGRKFQARVIGSPILDKFEEEDVTTAWVLLEREERRVRQTNLFRQNRYLASFTRRNY